MNKFQIFVITILMCGLLLVLTASADATRRVAGSFYLGASTGLHWEDDKDNNAGGLIYGASIGIHPGPNWSACMAIEQILLTFSHYNVAPADEPIDRPVDGAISNGSGVTLFGPQLTYVRPLAGKSMKYSLSAGFGVAIFSVSNSHINDKYFSLGIGLHFGNNRNGYAFVQARVIHFLKAKSPSDLIPLTAGIAF